jgi:hypothetical protein
MRRKGRCARAVGRVRHGGCRRPQGQGGAVGESLNRNPGGASGHASSGAMQVIPAVQARTCCVMEDKTKGHPPTSATDSESLLGSPTLRQRHGLHTSSLETSSPEVKPSAKRVHHLESGDSTIKRKPRGRRPKLTAAEQKEQLQVKAGNWFSLHPEGKAKEAVAYMMKTPDGIKVGRWIIERQIVRPVFQKLKPAKRLK